MVEKKEEKVIESNFNKNKLSLEIGNSQNNQ